MDRSDLSIIATGPGDVTWKENIFRKMTLNMYKKFVDKTNSLVNSQADKSVEHIASSSNHQEDNTESQMLGLLETTSATDSPVLKNISVLMDMIHTLQGQVTKLTAEVNKLVIQASDPLDQTVSETRTTLQSQTSPKKILLIGDSLISGINKNGLKANVYKHGISGATVDTVLNELLVYDLHRFSHAIIYVGGNDASSRTDIEYFEEKYEQLLVHIQENSQCKILLVNSCPRGDVDTGEVNEVIQGLKEHHKLELVDVHEAFFNRNGELIRRYYSWDSIHLSDSGVKRLLGTINNKVNIVEDFSRCVFTTAKRTGRKPPSRTRTHYQQQADTRISPCMKCGENNHETRDCKHSEQLKMPLL